MSLINQMLRDLDRQQRPQENSAAAVDKRTGPVHRRGWPLPLLVGTSLLAAVLLCWWLAGLLVAWWPPVGAPSAPPAEPQVAVRTAPQPQSPTPGSDQRPEPQNRSLTDTANGPDEQPPEAAEQTTASAQPITSPPVSRAVSVPPPAVRQNRPSPVRTNAPQSSAGERPRLRPEDLPGAVTSSHAKPQAVRTTPFGAAETAHRQAVQAYRDNRITAAIRLLQQALSNYSGHLPARELLADILEMEGRGSEAMALLAEGLEVDPANAGLKKRLARLLIDQGENAAAIRVLLASGMPAVTDDPGAHALLASLYQDLEEGFLAAQTYRNLLAAWPQTGAFWVGLGRALETQGLPAQAHMAYRRALTVSALPDELRRQVEQRLGDLSE